MRLPAHVKDGPTQANFDVLRQLPISIGTVDPEGVIEGSPGEMYFNLVTGVVWFHKSGVTSKTGWEAYQAKLPYIDYGPWQTAVVAPGAASDVSTTVTHNLNLSSNQQTQLTLVNGQSIDGSFAALMGTPRVESQTANAITLKIGNPSSIGISAAFRFWLRVPLT